MRLLQKVNRNYLWYTLVVFFIVGIGLLLSITRILRNEVDEKLNQEYLAVREQVRTTGIIPDNNPMVRVEKILAPVPFTPSFSFKDSLLIEEPEQDSEKYRFLIALDTIKDHSYRFEVWTSLIQTTDLLWILLLTVGLAMLLLVSGLLLLNQRIARSVWMPFRQYLDQLNRFSFEAPRKITLSPSDIDEFKELKNVLESFTAQAQSDFNNLKEFTVNASHEMQTPLAIIQTRLDDLFQDKSLDPQQALHLQAMQQALSRLSRLNQTLILLTRIENNQFQGLKQIELSAFLAEQVESVRELAQTKSLEFTTDLIPFEIGAQPELLGIAIGNLLGNCIKHANPGTEIRIKLDGKNLIFTNEGPPVKSDPNDFFNQFVKGDPSSGSLGLGLTLVKKICDHFKWRVTYDYQSGWHSVKIDF